MIPRWNERTLLESVDIYDAASSHAATAVVLTRAIAITHADDDLRPDSEERHVKFERGDR